MPTTPLLLALVVLAAGVADAQTTGVRLRIMSDGDAAPLRRVKVVAVTGGGAASPVFTNDEGSVAVSGIAGGTVLQVSKAGFAPQAITLPSPLPTTFDVGLAPAAVITGRVVDSRGQAAVRVRVMVRRVQPLPAAIPAEAQLRTDDRGEFRAGNLVAGNYVLHTQRGYELVSLAQDGSAAARAAREQQAQAPLSDIVQVAAGPGEQVDVLLTHAAPSVEFSFSEGGAITGTLVDEHGEPAEGYRVTLRPLGETGPFHMGVTGVSDDRGQYRVFQVPPGRYVVMATSAAVPELAPVETWPLLPVYYPGRLNPVEAVALTVERNSETPGIDMAVPTARGARIFGQVSPAGAAAGMRVTVWPSAGFRATVVDVRGTTVAADGSFEVRNLPPGNYVVQALSPVVNDRPSPETDFRFASQTLIVNTEDIGPITVAPAPTSTIRGRFVFEGDPAGVTISDVRLAVLPADPTLSPDPGMTRGAIAIAVAEPREWRFRISALFGPTRFGVRRVPDGWWLKAVRVGGVDAAIEPATFGAPSNSRDDVEIVLAPTAAAIAGRLVERDRQAVDVYTVIAFSTDRDRWFEGSSYVKSTTSRSDGSFLVPGLPPGDYYIAAIEYSELDPTAQEVLHPDTLAALASSAHRVTLGEREAARIEARLLPRPR